MVDRVTRFHFFEHDIDTTTFEITRRVLDTQTGIFYTIGLNEDTDQLLKLVRKDSRNITLKNLLDDGV